MSTTNGTTMPQQQGPDGTASTQSRRNQVMLGDLPQDFLRSGQTQVQEDGRVAHVLHAQQVGGVQTVTSNIAGRLSVSIIQARLNKNYGLVKMDPYCRVRVGHTVFETPTAISGGKNPNWNKTVQIFLSHGVDSVYIEIFDEKSFTLDDRVAWAVVPIPRAVMSGETADEWHNLSGRLGDGLEGSINIVLSLLPAASMPQQMVTSFTGPMMMPMFIPQPMMGQPMMQPMMQPMGQPMVPQQMAYPGQPGVVGTQQQTAVAVTESDVQQVKDMFPSMEKDVIHSVLVANHGNKDAAINALLSMSTE